MNPLFQQQVQQPTANNISQMYQMFKSFGNPMNAIQQMCPQAIPLLQSGNTPEQIFRALCQQRGMNADEIIEQIRSNIR